MPGFQKLSNRIVLPSLLLLLSAVVAMDPCLLPAQSGTAQSGAESGWARFHGEEGRGDAGDGQIPNEWTEADYAWRRELGARDVGSPVIVDGKVFYLVSKPQSEQLALESLDLRTGALRWSKEFPLGQYHLHVRNSYAASTPAADSSHVFVAFANPDHTYLKCLDHDGNEIWSRDFGTWQSEHGFGTSPRIFGDLVLLLNSQTAEQLDPGQIPGSSRMIAVNRSSGETVWESPLTTTRTCYGVPAIYQKDGVTQIIAANTGNGLFGIDPKTGQMLWNRKVFDMRVCSTPLVAGDLAIGTAGSGGGGNHLVAVRIPSKPDQEPEEVYRVDRGAPYVPTPVLRGDRLFMVDDKGLASCMNVNTGEMLWIERIGGRQGYGASPIVVGDKMLIISLGGDATVLRASDTFEKLGEMDLGGAVGASPAFAEGFLLLRVDDEIRCLGGKSI